jgi:hypothetical protein
MYTNDILISFNLEKEIFCKHRNSIIKHIDINAKEGQLLLYSMNEGIPVYCFLRLTINFVIICNTDSIINNQNIKQKFQYRKNSYT